MAKKESKLTFKLGKNSVLSETVEGIFNVASASVGAFGRISAASITSFGSIASSAIAAGGSVISAAMLSRKRSDESGDGGTQIVVVDGGGAVGGPPPRPRNQTTPVSKPTMSGTMGVNELLAVMVDQLSSIQSTLSQQIVAENQLAKSEEMASKEADIERKRGFIERIRETYGTAKGKVKRGASLLAGALVAAAVIAKLANIKWDDILTIADSAKQLVAGIKNNIMKSMDKIILLGGLISLMYTGLPGLIINLLTKSFPFLIQIGKFGIEQFIKFILPNLLDVLTTIFPALLPLVAAGAVTALLGYVGNELLDKARKDSLKTLAENVKKEPTLKQFGISLNNNGTWYIEPLKKSFAPADLPAPYDEIINAFNPGDRGFFSEKSKADQKRVIKNIEDGIYTVDPETKELKLASPTGRTNFADEGAPATKLAPPLKPIITPNRVSIPVKGFGGHSKSDNISTMSQQNSNAINFPEAPATSATPIEMPSSAPGAGTVANRASSTIDEPFDPNFIPDPSLSHYFQYFDKAA